MDMLGFLGKKVDLVCNGGKQFSGYVFDVSDAEDSDIGCDSVDIALLGLNFNQSGDTLL